MKSTLDTVAMDFWGKKYDELPYHLRGVAKDLLSDIEKHQEMIRQECLHQMNLTQADVKEAGLEV